ncbi:leucyl aminopeptidase [Chryseobacterium angstadtii]|uniref:Leucyl aminopeptidase n=1 Tax=Chryseobacterium angstadtii TaxID=558151 RepID=A0A0J7IG66_9FLAO|nr:M28 family peptidase [Chryseobacterium angstadtii]KMQ65067.1 leucyl aminopeptidase [Chryseobacterium angstadtii]
MKKISTIILLSLSAYSLQAQNFIQAYQTRVDKITQANITSNLQQFSDLGVKTTGSVENTNALNWLKAKYESYGYTASQITEDAFTYGASTSKNLIITKTGTLYPNTYVVICGHYDTVTGPGVSDNGSGTSILLEAARILKDVPTDYSIKFIHFSGEEQGLLGSKHYVNNVIFQNNARQVNLKLVFNIDQVGGKIGNVNSNITCESDQSGQTGNNAASLAVTQELATCTTLYSPLQPTMSNAYASDYISFENKGDIITGFYETTRSHNEHTVNDTFANIDPVYVFNVGKAALGALQHYAGASSTLGTDEVYADNPLETIKIYPNPAQDVLHIELPKENKNFQVEISDMNGRLLINAESEKKINTSALMNGVYMVTVKSDKNSITKKIIIEK